MASGSDVIERPEVVAATPDPVSPRRWVVPVLLVVGWVLSVAWRMWLSRHIVLPIAHTDEDSYLNTARALAGGPGGFSSENDLLRRVGYPMLISPAFLGDRDFSDSYRIVQLINAMINSTLLPLAYLLGRRLLRLPRSYALLGAVAAATLPATAFYAGIAMIDTVMAPLVVAWLLTVHRWIERPGPLAAATVGLLVGGFHLLHSRGLVIVAVHAGLVLLLFVRRRINPPAVLAALLPVLAMALVNATTIRYLGDKVYLLGSTPGGGTVEAVASAQGVVRVGAAVATQLWYLVVITFGMAGVAWASAVRELWRPRHGDATRWTMGVALVVTVGVAGGASVILAGITGKPLDAIYGRYVQMLAPFWLLVGLGVLLTAGRRVVVRRAAVAVALLVGGGALIAARLAYVASRGHYLRYGGFGAPDLMALTGGWREMRPVVGSLVGIAGCLLLAAAVLVPRLRMPALGVIVVANLVTMQVIDHRMVRPMVASSTPTPSVADVGVRPGERVWASTGVHYILRFNLSHQVTWTDVRWFGVEQPPTEAQVVFARWAPGRADDWDGTAYGFVRLGGNQAQHWAAWRRA
ncbi:glycosyltransferase family 39 protein [Micromonospora chokoriensis]|uniref:Dolichyl-phosphate-mannose-protein mannosyltransferase n=1 Tax=Micromonospora chokoriensis TaxID=356851 RepID=A0A1C4Z0Y7_9ACTN|nr:glycosyltransferase family 39 protein [Micromonospora chokoriensis]SCF26261.1 Dolichyl-phosphate-mannose-protein mannosyltransferase [Micromonospora chokoriensis]